jgi:hypothetical protein
MTPSEFDREVVAAFKKDTFHLKRLEGLLDFKSLWNKWLNYEQYGTTRINSAQAKRQGGRAHEPMCLFFFMGDSEFPGQVLMKYKYRESDPYFMPYNHEGIPVLSDEARALPDLLVEPCIVPPKAWPDKSAIEKYLTTQLDLTPAQKQEWRKFFDEIPERTEDIPESKKFKWILPQLAKTYQERRNHPSSDGHRVGETEPPAKPDERVIWSQYTRADFNRDQRQREANYAREQHALQERIRSEQLASATAEHSDDKSSLPSSSASSSSESSCPPSSPRVCRFRTTRQSKQGYDKGEDARSPAARDDSESGNSDTDSLSSHSSSKSFETDSSEKIRSKSKKRGHRTAAHAAKKLRISKLSLGDSGVVEVGDFVLFNPDVPSQAADRANGYTLGMCMGKVLEIDSRKKLVMLWWLFGTEWSRKVRWKFWRFPGTSQRYTDWIDAKSLLVTSFGTLAKVKLVSQKRETFTIDRASISTILDVISTNE